MPAKKMVDKVWIEDGCIVCDTCTANCPEVFEIRDDQCLVRPEALEKKHLSSLSDLIIETAVECPAEVIKYNLVETNMDTEVPRRKVVSAAGIGWLALGSSAVLGGLTLQRFMYPNALEQPDPKVGAGKLDRFIDMPVHSVNEDFKLEGILIVRLENKIVALSTACTHLGCIVSWHESEGVFKCPCHGSGFSYEGINQSGPAGRPLERFKISVEQEKVVVDRSRKYRREKGEWNNPDTFIQV